MSQTPRPTRRGVLRTGIAAAAGALVSQVLPASIESIEPGQSSQSRTVGKTREYWIQADSIEHNFVPSGIDPLMGGTLKPADTTIWAIGYRVYTPNWEKLVAGNDDIGPNTGIPGPIIRAQVGDTVIVHFRNNDQYYAFPHSMHFHGFSYEPASDGSYVFGDGDKPGTVLRVGESYIYELRAKETSVGTWVYHDHSMAQSLRKPPKPEKPHPGRPLPAGAPPPSNSNGSVMDGDILGGQPMMELTVELGLAGLCAITHPHERPVDREFFVLFQDLYAAHIPGLGQDIDLVNGYSFIGNTPIFAARVGDRVRWRVGAIGKEFHVFHLHGHRWLQNGIYVDSVVLGPATTLTAEFVEDEPGEWLYHCHVPEHMMGGMVGKYVVANHSSGARKAGSE